MTRIGEKNSFSIGGIVASEYRPSLREQWLFWRSYCRFFVLCRIKWLLYSCKDGVSSWYGSLLAVRSFREHFTLLTFWVSWKFIIICFTVEERKMKCGLSPHFSVFPLYHSLTSGTLLVWIFSLGSIIFAKEGKHLSSLCERMAVCAVLRKVPVF